MHKHQQDTIAEAITQHNLSISDSVKPGWVYTERDILPYIAAIEAVEIDQKAFFADLHYKKWS